MKMQNEETPAWQSIAGWLALLGLTALAVYLRFDALDLKPLHHDEGVNGQFTRSLVNNFRYTYNPYNFHGPLLYFLGYLPAKIMGLTPAALRFMPAIFGALAVPAMWLFRRKIGWMGVLLSALFVTIAPVELYFSKTAIHEIYNFTFVLTLVGGFYYWWQTGRRWALLLASLSLAFLFATKETTALTMAAMVPAIIAAWYIAKPTPTFPGKASLPLILRAVGPRRWQTEWPEVQKDLFNVSALNSEQSAAKIWSPKNAPEDVMAASTHLKETIRAFQEASMRAEDAHSEARAQARAGALVPPPDLPWGIKNEATAGRIVQAVEKAGRDGVPVEQPLPAVTGWRKIPIVGTAGTFLAEAWKWDSRGSWSALSLFVVVMVLLFTSFFTNPKGIISFFEAFVGWGKTGVEGSGHTKVWSYWIENILVVYYVPLLFVALPALVIQSLKRDAFAIFTLLWFALVLAAYSAIPYKTPWCVVSFSAPLFIGLGLGVQMAIDGLKRLLPDGLGHKAGMLASAAVVLVLAYPTWDYWTFSERIQYEEYDVDAHPFIYVQNIREFLDLATDVQAMVDVSNTAFGKKPSIWLVKARTPLRFYVDEIETCEGRPVFDDAAKKKAKKSDIVIAHRASAKDARKTLKGPGVVYREYHERPGQRFDVFIKKPLWDAWQKAAKAGKVPAPTDKIVGRTVSDKVSKMIRDVKKAKKAKKGN